MSKPDLAERYELEKSKWDAQAKRMLNKKDFVSTEDFYSLASKEPPLAYVARFLGDVQGKRVLEYGCGLGYEATFLAKSGAIVTGFDLSSGRIAIGVERAVQNQVSQRVMLHVAAAEALPYEDASFDIVFGKAILHHVDSLALPEIWRVLRPGGKVAFIEPLGCNPLLSFVRERVWYPGKEPRGVDHPLTYDDIAELGKGYSRVAYCEFHLLSVVERAFGYDVRFPILRKLDRILLARYPALRRYCRLVAIALTK